MPRYRLTITKEFEDSLWGIEEFLADYENREEGLAAFIEIMQEDIVEVVYGAHWQLEEATEGEAQ